jgi:hypothetical protein
VAAAVTTLESKSIAMKRDIGFSETPLNNSRPYQRHFSVGSGPANGRIAKVTLPGLSYPDEQRSLLLCSTSSYAAAMCPMCMLGSPNTSNAIDHVVRVNRCGINNMVPPFMDAAPNHAYLVHKRQTRPQGVTLDGEVPSRGKNDDGHVLGKPALSKSYRTWNPCEAA